MTIQETTTALTDLLQRLSVLESIEEIRALRADYFSGLDRRDLERVRNLFRPDAVIGMGEAGTFTDRESFLTWFEDECTGPSLFDLHHGANHRIFVDSDTTAHGTWDAYYNQLDTAARTTYTDAYYYEDEYVKVDGRWWISKTTINTGSTFQGDIAEDGTLKITKFGR